MIHTHAMSRYCSRFFVVPILYSDSLSNLLSTIQGTLERYCMHLQLTMYGQENFGNYHMGGYHQETHHPGSSSRNTYSCIYCVEFHTKELMVEWQKHPRVGLIGYD